MSHQITEACQHDPAVALPGGAALVEAGPVMPGDSCGYAHRIVLAIFGEEYATWDAAYPDDEGAPFCFNGHYFRDIAKAAADYKERCARGF